MSRVAVLALCVLFAEAPVSPAADEVAPAKQYQTFVLKQAAELRKADRAPTSLDEWQKQEAELRKNLLAAWGGFPEKRCALDPTQHGDPLKRDGYTVEKLTLQTRPGVRMTANLYVPDAAKKQPAPAILMVHGHWKGAKQDPVVQSRCIGAAKLGFVVLCVDAFGAGERGVGTALGEYHGDMTAATLLPLGTPLSGLQVYENMRAVDYLETRPEVDKSKIGITGASGGGNQTMYAGAWDKRFKCVVPVCSVGNYQAYLQAACCMCEVVPGALKFTEEWAILGLTAPRPLMVVSATQDAFQFSVGEAKKSLARTAPVYKLLGKPDHLQHVTFESPHDYSKAMREVMYGFMTLHLKNEGKGDPIPEPKFETEKPEDLRCFPGDTRPKGFMTIPKFAAQEGEKLRDAKPEFAATKDKEPPAKVTPKSIANFQAREAALEKILGLPKRPQPQTKGVPHQDGATVVNFSPEPGIELSALMEFGHPDGECVILLNLDGAEAARKSAIYAELKKTGATVVTFDLRGTGKRAAGNERVGRAPDHNSAEWGLWLGQPLLGQWVHDVESLLNLIWLKGEARARKLVLIGEGPAGLIALADAARNGLAHQAVAVNTLASFVTNEPYADQRLGVIAPGILRELGDVSDLAAMYFQNHVDPGTDGEPGIVIAGGVAGNGRKLSMEELKAAYEPAMRIFKLHMGDYASSGLRLVEPRDAVAVLHLTPKDGPIFDPSKKLEKLAGDGAAGEGPAWDPKCGVFTSGEKGIHQLTPTGEKKIWREKAGTNGLLFDRDGNLVCCEPVSRTVSRIDRTGKRTVLTDSFGGKKYNQPNDLTIDSKNRIYFSDPRYGPRTDMQQKDEKGNTIEGVYRIDPDGTVSRVIGREVERANGVLVSSDDKYLFVADNNNDTGGARKLYRFDLKPDGGIDPKSQKLLHDWGQGRGPDGVKQDAKGRLYVAGGLNKPNPPAEPAADVKGGIYVIDPESGKLLAFVAVPTDEVTNCAFGGGDLKTLYITGGGTLYSTRTTTPGRVIWPKK